MIWATVRHCPGSGISWTVELVSWVMPQGECSEMIDPIGGFDRIRDFFITYLDTAFRIGNDEIQQRRRSLLETPGTLCTDPQLEPLPRYRTAPFRVDELATDPALERWLPGFSTDEKLAWSALVLSGLLEAEELPNSALPPGRGAYKLYQHQAEMLRRGVQVAHPGIVTSGTGSGKTEAFLLPILAMLAREAARWPRPNKGYLTGRRWWIDPGTGQPYSCWEDVPGQPSASDPESSPFVLHRNGEANSRPRGVRALILYPMNALVEDQLVRLRRALDSETAHATMDRYFNGNRLFFGRYTSATEVTGYLQHPRLSAREYLPAKRRRLERLFKSVKEYDLTQRACSNEEDPGLRFNFPNPCGSELVTRWDMQATPPDIMITNISMLSAMLAREVDCLLYTSRCV